MSNYTHLVKKFIVKRASDEPVVNVPGYAQPMRASDAAHIANVDRYWNARRDALKGSLGATLGGMGARMGFSNATGIASTLARNLGFNSMADSIDDKKNWIGRGLLRLGGGALGALAGYAGGRGIGTLASNFGDKEQIYNDVFGQIKDPTDRARALDQYVSYVDSLHGTTKGRGGKKNSLFDPPSFKLGANILGGALGGGLVHSALDKAGWNYAWDPNKSLWSNLGHNLLVGGAEALGTSAGISTADATLNAISNSFTNPLPVKYYTPKSGLPGVVEHASAFVNNWLLPTIPGVGAVRQYRTPVPMRKDESGVKKPLSIQQALHEDIVRNEKAHTSRRTNLDKKYERLHKS